VNGPAVPDPAAVPATPASPPDQPATGTVPGGRAVPAELAAAVRAWIAADPDPATQAELEQLLAAGDVAALRNRFDEPLEFGTAGLRGALGAGPARMNRAVVRRTAAGVARWLLARGEAAAEAGIVVGRDARHGSAEFAADTVEVVAALGVRVRVLPQPLPTPLTAFAVLHYGAAAGVMVTASHNPAPDNGYKVYAGDGAQIVPPDDRLIADAAAAGPPPAPGTPPATPRLVIEVGRNELLDAYTGVALAVLRPDGPRAVRAVYTPVHGVGGEVLPRLMARAGFDQPFPVTQQARPDPDFPTAAFPNPEEPGVLDLALARAAMVDADVVLANDPDADRLAVAVPGAGGDWRVLSGDELGWLLGDELIARHAATASAVGGGIPVVACSIVSSTLLSEVAAAAGTCFAETLTGFKWIARAADPVPAGRLLFGYEEALGYAVTPAVRDKDGLTAALLVAELAAAAREEGRPLTARLDALALRFGVHLTSQWSLRLEGGGAHERLLGLVDRWRNAAPQHLGDFTVVEVDDLERGLHGLPPTPGVSLRLTCEEGSGEAGDSRTISARVVVRPSGTEPKLKCYLEVVVPRPQAVAAGDDGSRLEEDRSLASREMASLRAAVASDLGASPA
jgi:phosphomannomutase